MVPLSLLNSLLLQPTLPVFPFFQPTSLNFTFLLYCLLSVFPLFFLMSAPTPVSDFLSMLDFCFDLDVDLDLGLGKTLDFEFRAVVTLPTPEKVHLLLALACEAASPMVAFALWWSRLHASNMWSRPAPKPRRPILKSKYNRNFVAERVSLAQADCESVESFCSKLEVMLTTPGDVEQLHRERKRQVTNYYRQR